LNLFFKGECGSCYIFTAIGALESQILIAKQFEKSFSEEQVADCIYTYNTKLEDLKELAERQKGNGCEGGFSLNVFQYIEEVGGITTEHDYEYTLTKSNTSKTCRFKRESAVQNVGKYGSVYKPTEHLLKQLLVAKGPVNQFFLKKECFKN